MSNQTHDPETLASRVPDLDFLQDLSPEEKEEWEKKYDLEQDRIERMWDQDFIPAQFRKQLKQ